VCQLINEWKFLSAKEMLKTGEKAGYIVGMFTNNCDYENKKYISSTYSVSI